MVREVVTRARGAGGLRERRVVTPLARRIAEAHGFDLAGLAGTGRDGRICAADVRALIGPDPRAQPPISNLLISNLPIATITFEVDVTDALATDAGLAAVVAAEAAGLLATHHELNGAWGGDAAVLRRRVHVAVGEAGGAGLRWAVVRDAADLTARGVARALAAGAGGEATFAVICLGGGASWQSAEPPLPGTAAALSVGAPARRAVAHGEGVAVRAVAALTLSYDARLIDHGRAAAFLRDLRGRLERPGAPAAAGPVL